MKIIQLGTILALISYFSVTILAQHNPLKDPTICGRPICEEGSKFNFTPNVEYKYSYNLEIHSTFNGTTKNESKITISSTAIIKFITSCDGVLKLQDIKLNHGGFYEEEQHFKSSELGSKLNEFSLRFAFHDGIVSELCPAENEEQWVLNFKRGLLSLLHNTMKRFDLDYVTDDEEDVQGKCITQYIVGGAKETSLIIQKSKDLNSCQTRSKLLSIVQSVPYNLHSEIHAEKNLLNSNTECVIEIDHRVYKSIKCTESHIFKPFSKQKSGASTKIIQELNLINEILTSNDESGDFEQQEISQRTSLFYNHNAVVKTIDSGELRIAWDLIKNMCEQHAKHIHTEFVNQFTVFIQTLRTLPYATLVTLNSHASTCSTGQKHLLDALPFVGTVASVEVMKEMIMKGLLPEEIENEWRFSLAFLPNPNKEILAIANEILQAKPEDTVNLLTISALTHTFCTQNSKCHENSDVESIVYLIQRIITDSYRESKFDQQKLLIALKALGNIGVIFDDFFIEHLVKIIENESESTQIRIAAIESLRRTNCADTRNFFELLFRNENVNSEVRIASYLQIMRCPDYLMIRGVKHVLEHEKVNQVGSFIWTHLSNMIKSAVPSSLYLQSILSDIEIQKKYDARKYSQNRQGSIYFDEYDVGGNFDGNLIFSTNSYVPKSAMLNLTVAMFGQSINLFEIYGRFEGFEPYIESFFGPKGSLNPTKLGKNISRWARNIRTNETDIQNSIERLPNVFEGYGEPKIEYGFKVFGNDLKYDSIHGEREFIEMYQNFNYLNHIKRILSGKEINYNKAGLFLDTKYVVPTGAGLPLSLSAIGTYTVNVQLFGDLKAPGNSASKEFSLKLNLSPSVSLDVIGTMTVDAYFTSTAIKLRSSVYTSSAIEADIKLKGTKLARVKLSHPQQTSEIFVVKSELIVVEKGIEKKQSGLIANKIANEHCTWSTISQTIGLKLCGEYHFTNLTETENAPHLMLAAPLGFRIYTEKTDPTAIIYLFEYEWIDNDDTSLISIVFDTPDSKIKRLLSANFTIEKQSKNLTLFLQSSAGTILAKGHYKNTELVKYLIISLSINDKNHFDLSAFLNSDLIKNGYLHYPKLYLGVKGERVLEIGGTLKSITKRNISQNDIDIKLQTKRLTSKLFGYLSKSDTSFAGNFKLDYKFINIKEQRVKMDFYFANRSPKNLIDIRGSSSMISTSYPNFNYDAKLKFQRGSGPIECKFDLISNPLPPTDPDADMHKLVLQWILSYKASTDATRNLNTQLSVKRESTGLNLKAQLSWHLRESDVDTVFIVKYGEKEVTITAYWLHPRNALEHIEGRLNVTVPSFTPMILQFKVQEKIPANYLFEVKGTWFSGHSALVNGFYQDKSIPRSLNHHLKFILKSPSFTDINTDLKFYRDNDEIRLDFKVIQDDDHYKLFFKHSVISSTEILTQVKIFYKNKNYSLLSSVYLGDHRQISVEIHIDDLRDIHLAIWHYNKDSYKAAGVEVKLDANRDNNKKFVISGNFTKLAPLMYEGNMLIAYPGRTILSNFDFHFKKQHFNVLARLSWADQKSLALTFQLDYDMERQMYFLVKAQIATPFEGWHKTTISTRYQHFDNIYQINGTVQWRHDEFVRVSLYEHYTIHDDFFACKFEISLNSTLNNIPSLSAYLDHDHNSREINSKIKLMYDPQSVIDIKSKWRIYTTNFYSNLTGTIVGITPFNGFKRCYLISKIYYNTRRYMKGFSNLDLEHKKYIVNLDGNLEKLTNSMLVVNVTTPIEKFRKVMARFGFSEKRRNLVAQIVYPSGSTGFEILLAIESLTNFDVEFSLGLPISVLQQVLLVARLKQDKADFRAGWNSLLAGFTGVWHYENLTDFEYLCKIFTPFERFKENGIVAKIIYKNGIDFEASARLSDHKIGLAIIAHPQLKILSISEINIKNIFMNENEILIGDSSSEGNEDNENDEDLINWTGQVEIDTLLYPTIQGSLDINQEGKSVFITQMNLQVPDGNATLIDEFEYNHILSMKNHLKLTTPYTIFNTVISKFLLEVIPESKYQTELSFEYQNGIVWVKTGASGKYTIIKESIKNKKDVVQFNLHTPLENFPLLVVNGDLSQKSDNYQANFYLATNNSHVNLALNTEQNGEYLKVNLNVSANTPSIHLTPTKILLIKDAKPQEKMFKLFINNPERLERDINMQVNWNIESLEYFHGIVSLQTPYKGMEHTYTGVDVKIIENYSTGWFALQLHPIDVNLNTSLTSDVLHAVSLIKINGRKIPITLISSIVKTADNRADYSGVFSINEKKYTLTGYSVKKNYIPSEIYLNLEPENRAGDSVHFKYNLNTIQNGYVIFANLQKGDVFTKLSTNLTNQLDHEWLLDLKVDTSSNIYNKFMVHGNYTNLPKSKSVSIVADTSIPNFETPKLGASLKSVHNMEHGIGYFEVTEAKGKIEVDFIWKFLENMYLNGNGSYENREYSSISSLTAFYKNPEKKFESIQLGGDINVDKSIFSAGSNLTLKIPSKNRLYVETYLKLPIGETHSVLGQLYYHKTLHQYFYLGKYSTAVSKKKFASLLNGNFTEIQKFCEINVEWNKKYFNNTFKYVDSKEKGVHGFYGLETPKFASFEPFNTNIIYSKIKPKHHVELKAFYQKQIANANIDFEQFSNMNGTINMTIPNENIKFININFITKTDEIVYNRFANVSWVKDNAILDVRCNTDHLEKSKNGILKVEVPLTTRHIADANFSYQDKISDHQNETIGSANLKYNGNHVLDSSYKRLTKKIEENSKDIIDAEFKNMKFPFGVNYVHTFDIGTQNSLYNENRHIHVYHLENIEKLNISGDINVGTTKTGRVMRILAKHPNRTIIFITDYNLLEKEITQHSRLELSPENWIDYDLKLTNETKDEDTFDLRKALIKLSYPRRSFTINSHYNLSETHLSSDVEMNWNEGERSVRGEIEWIRLHQHENMKLVLKHPSFEKDVLLQGEYSYNSKKLYDIQGVFDYSLEPEQRLEIGSTLNDNSNDFLKNFTYNIWAKHEATNLNLDTSGILSWNQKEYKSSYHNNYQRSYLPLQEIEALGRLDLHKNELELKKLTGEELLYLLGKYQGNYPKYTTNISLVQEMNNNITGEFLLNFAEKLIKMDVNLTTDGSQSLHTFGVIPDTRSATFNTWRDYEEIRISDIAFYLKLNHSRLIMSNLIWRPKLIHDIRSGLRTLIMTTYNNILENINNTKQYVRSEMNDAIIGVINDAKPNLEQFLDDLRALREIESDFNEFKEFLNASYYANEFYIKDIVDTCKVLLDDLALKAQLESFPAIVKEIWQIMGESGTKIKESVDWVAEKIKMYYAKTSEFIRSFLEGDPIEHLSEVFKSILEKYDAFSKDLHVSFIRHIEQLWEQTYSSLVDNWNRALAAIEPTFIKLAHYVETICWNTGRDFLDFLYMRKNELIESPYFVKFTKLSHDLDVFYKDITGPNTLGAIRKYIGIVWTFIEEKYFNLVPFSKELQDVAKELFSELGQLKNLPSVQFLYNKCEEWWYKIKWFSDYFELEVKFQRFLLLVQQKLIDFSQTALEAENNYRVAKTKFIFEPADGVMLLEQKLPMSWHAFNETPKFQEIPEIGTLYKIQKYFSASKTSFWDFYYQYKTFTDPSEVLPPFKTQALLIGSKHYITFDQNYYIFEGKCTYLLAKDNVDGNFSVLISYERDSNAPVLILVIEKTTIYIDVYANRVKIGERDISLPSQIGNTKLYYESNIVTVESADLGYSLECNMMFKICTFEVSGYYFGKTAGLWGTINNEQYDDLLTSHKKRDRIWELDHFTKSWTISDSCKQTEFESKSITQKPNELCDEFYNSKVSELTRCFTRVPKEPFLKMCLSSTNKDEICTSVVAYIKLCNLMHTPISVPDVCVTCTTPKGTTINEGQFVRLNGSDLPQSVDNVFIIDTKACNRNLNSTKSIDIILESLDKEFSDVKLTNNRYALVTYGGEGVFEQPRSFLMDNGVFTDAKKIVGYFDSIPAAPGDSDIYAALAFASRLPFRAGVRKNFILLPCSECREENMSFDYNGVHQLLAENNIVLHIMMEKDFSLGKTQDNNKSIYGIDRVKVYSRKDAKHLTGDTLLKRRVRFAKASLGNCLPLALESNGTLFTKQYLNTDRKNSLKRFASVFAKRVAASVAKPLSCVNCECSSFETGVSYMECYPCSLQIRSDLGNDDFFSLISL